MRIPTPLRRAPRQSAHLLIVAAVLGLIGCGSSTATDQITLSPAGEAGRKVAQQKGCASCHGSDGGGKVGPPFVGLYGSEVQLQDGTSVTANDEYIRTSILDPSFQKVEGFNLPMPKTTLSDAELDSLLEYIRELGAPAATDTSTTGTTP